MSHESSERSRAAHAAARSAEAVLPVLVGTLDWLLARPIRFLGPLIAVQVGATALLAALVPHNGAVWYQGGDQLWHSTYASMIGRLVLPPADVGFAWGLAAAPLTWFTGPTFPRLIPALAALQVLVLAPLALLCIYGIARELAGRRFAYWAALLWVAAPYACIPLFVGRYHEKWTDQFLPQALGLTALADLPSLVALLGSAYLVVRSISLRSLPHALVGGLVLGFAVDMKPSNLIFAFGPAVAFAAARAWPAAGAYAAGVAPGMLALAIWKQRGLGELPLLRTDGDPLALGAVPAREEESWFETYVQLDFDHLQQQVRFLHEFFHAAELAEAAPIAGLFALLVIRALPIAGLLGGWLVAFTIVKGTAPTADIQAGSFFRLLMPAWPAYFLLLAAAPLLIPPLGRWARRERPRPQGRPPSRRAVTAAVAIGLLPLFVSVGLRSGDTSRYALLVTDRANILLTPVDPDIDLRVTRRGGVNELAWTTPDYHADVVQRIYRARPATSGMVCEEAGVRRCTFDMPILVRRARGGRFVDKKSFPAMTYRIGVAAHYKHPRAFGDLFAVSPAVSARG